jgi:DNA-cytosine methyltransferase
MKLKTLDLFSGIGGFSLGLESTGFFETIGFVEKDKFCQKVLKKHWSNINIEEDIRNVKGEKYQADVVTGGFPCQPFSVAGKRKSTADDRYLWDEMLRVIRETKPRWVIGENVEGIVNINEGMVLRQVLNDLENEGFKSQCIIIPASGIGAWHQRKRIWIVANNSNSNNNGSYRSQGNATKQSSNEQKDRLSFGDDKDVSNSSSHPTPTTRQDSASERTKKYKQGGMPLPMAVKMFPTPTASDMEGGTELKSGDDREWSFLPRKKNKPGTHSVQNYRMQCCTWKRCIQHQYRGITRMRHTIQLGRRAEIRRAHWGRQVSKTTNLVGNSIRTLWSS